jgi:hypothetical protein
MTPPDLPPEAGEKAAEAFYASTWRFAPNDARDLGRKKAEAALAAAWPVLIEHILTVIEEELDGHYDLSRCPYYQTEGLPDAERGTCQYGCRDEPECVTCEPSGGWPLARVRSRLTEDER